MTTQDNNQEAREGGEKCKRCDGEGVTHTGIDEAPTTVCSKCDGTGFAATQQAGAAVPSAAQSIDTPEFQKLMAAYGFAGRVADHTHNAETVAKMVAAYKALIAHIDAQFAQVQAAFAAAVSLAGETIEARNAEIESLRAQLAQHQDSKPTDLSAAAQGERATKAEIHTLRRLIECAEELNKRPRPMCRDCADEDGTCPNSGMECDMHKLFADAKALHNKLATPPASQAVPGDEVRGVLEAQTAAIMGFAEAAAESHLVTDGKRFMACAHETVARMRATNTEGKEQQ